MSRPRFDEVKPDTAQPTLKEKGRKVACVATLTAAGLSFGLIASGPAAADKLVNVSRSGDAVDRFVGLSDEKVDRGL